MCKSIKCSAKKYKCTFRDFLKNNFAVTWQKELGKYKTIMYYYMARAESVGFSLKLTNNFPLLINLVSLF